MCFFLPFAPHLSTAQVLKVGAEIKARHNPRQCGNYFLTTVILLVIMTVPETTGGQRPVTSPPVASRPAA
jgi:hypothetical protein